MRGGMTGEMIQLNIGGDVMRCEGVVCVFIQEIEIFAGRIYLP